MFLILSFKLFFFIYRIGSKQQISDLFYGGHGSNRRRCTGCDFDFAFPYRLGRGSGLVRVHGFLFGLGKDYSIDCAFVRERRHIDVGLCLFKSFISKKNCNPPSKSPFFIFLEVGTTLLSFFYFFEITE